MTISGVLQAASSAAEHACALTDSQWDDLKISEAVAVVEAISIARTQLDASLLKAIPMLEKSPALREAGWASAKDFLTHLLGGYKGTGGGLLRAVEQLRDLPSVQSALEEGRVTLPQARVIAAKVSTLPHLESFRAAVTEQMLSRVTEKGFDASDLQKSFDGIVADLDPDAEIMNAEKRRAQAERGAHHTRFLSFSEDAHGGVRVKGYGTIEDVEAIRATLFPLAAPVTREPGSCGGRKRRPDEPWWDENGVSTMVPCPEPGCAHDGRDVRDNGARMWDALVEACHQLRATETLPRDHGSHARVVVTVNLESLRQQAIEAGLARVGETSSGAHLSASVVRRLACDAEIIPAVLGAEGQPLDVARARRLVTPVIWNALMIRDKHCAFPGCSRLPLACDAHHIVHWADGGDTSLDNMIMLCRHHHTMVHQSPWTVHVDPATRRPLWVPPRKLRLSDLDGMMSYSIPGHPLGNGIRPRAA